MSHRTILPRALPYRSPHQSEAADLTEIEKSISEALQLLNQYPVKHRATLSFPERKEQVLQAKHTVLRAFEAVTSMKKEAQAVRRGSASTQMDGVSRQYSAARRRFSRY
jgi:hypothetical protein